MSQSDRDGKCNKKHSRPTHDKAADMKWCEVVGPKNKTKWEIPLNKFWNESNPCVTLYLLPCKLKNLNPSVIWDIFSHTMTIISSLVYHWVTNELFLQNENVIADRRLAKSSDVLVFLQPPFFALILIEQLVLVQIHFGTLFDWAFLDSDIGVVFLLDLPKLMTSYSALCVALAHALAHALNCSLYSFWWTTKFDFCINDLMWLNFTFKMKWKICRFKWVIYICLLCCKWISCRIANWKTFLWSDEKSQ